VLPLRYPNSVRLATINSACPYAKSSRSRWHAHSASFRFEIPDAAEHLENWLSRQGPEAIRSFSSQVLGETTSKAMPAEDNPPFLLQFHFFDHMVVGDEEAR
jgi:hypothetical protein